MNIFHNFFYKIFCKIFYKTHQIAPFFKIFLGSMPPNPSSKRVASPCKYPHFSKNILNPPRKEIKFRMYFGFKIEHVATSVTCL